MRTILILWMCSLGHLKANAQSNNFVIKDSLVADNAFRPQLALSKKGSYVVTWYDYLPPDEDRDVKGPRRPWKARLYDSNGQPLSSSLEINAPDRPLPLDVSSRVVMDDQGNFSCFWMEYAPEVGEGATSYEFSLFASRFDSSGQLIVQHEHVEQIHFVVGGLDLADFDVEVTTDRGFVIAWAYSESAFGPSNVMAQRFSKDLSPRGEPIKLNKKSWSEFETHSMVDLAMDEDDSFVVGWLERSFLDLPDLTKESYVTMSTAEVSSEDRLKTYSRQLARPVAESDDYLPPSIEMVDGRGYFILLPFWQMRGDDADYSTVLGSRYITKDGFQVVNWGVLPGFPIDWAVKVSATTTWERRLVVAYGDPSKQNASLRVGSLDQTLEPGNVEWFDVVSSQAASMVHPEIAAREDGTFVIVFEDVLVDRELSTPVRSVHAGILDLNAAPIPVVKPNPFSLQIERRDRGEVSVSWQSEEGRNYQLMTGSDIKALKISDEVTGDGGIIQRNLAVDEHEVFFIAVTMGE
ncbi:MAG: hypothetical protein ACFHW5_16025 [Verrucomicrobiota bacterium]